MSGEVITRRLSHPGPIHVADGHHRASSRPRREASFVLGDVFAASLEILTTHLSPATFQLNHQRERITGFAQTDVVSLHWLNPTPLPSSVSCTLPPTTGSSRS